MSELLEVRNLSKRYAVESGLFKTGGSVDAAKNVSFTIGARQTAALVGESGSGKSTVGKMIQGLIEPTAGEIFFEGKNAGSLSRSQRAHWVQMIFQDPFASLNPKLSVGTMLKEALSLSRKDGGGRTSNEEAWNLLRSVGLAADILDDYPHQFSGGQRQRLGVARALAMRPALIVADEPVSALDLSIQAQILNLLSDLKEQFGISYLLISHDLSVVEQMADKVLVMHRGQIVEEGPVDQIFSNPRESCTKTLLDSIPKIAASC